ncbi:hypothetical protein CLOP_g7160 [Closterium sp. NIES-67]|nr:hypothetical protein CLOP_g7160 [Closterium sp. NIES-67]
MNERGGDANGRGAVPEKTRDDVKPVLDKIKDTYARMAAAGSSVSQLQQCTKIISVLDNPWDNLIPTLNSQQDQWTPEGKPNVVHAGSVVEQIEEDEIAHCYWAPIPEPKTREEALNGPNGEKWKTSEDEEFGYAANHTRPDIAFATSRLASVVSRPSHEQQEAAKRLVRYIVKTHQQAADIFTKRLADADHWKGMKLAGMSVH